MGTSTFELKLHLWVCVTVGKDTPPLFSAQWQGSSALRKGAEKCQIDNKQTLRPPMPQRYGRRSRSVPWSRLRKKKEIKMGGACSRPKHGTCNVVVEALVLLIGRSTATLTNPRNATLRQLCTRCAAKHEKSCESHVSISCDEEALSQEEIFVQEHSSGLSRVLVKLHFWLAA